MNGMNIKREVAIALVAAWSASWAAEEQALQAATRGRMLSPTVVQRHLEVLRDERARVGALLS
jgi:hypothetical protein